MKKNKGYEKVKRALKKNILSVKVNGSAKKLQVKDGNKKYYGTADKIVFNLRFWDTASGRCSTNAEYMKLVSGRLIDFPVITDESKFLRELESRGLIEISKAN